MEIDWGNTATNERFMRHAFTGGEMLRLENDLVQVGKRALSNEGSCTTVNLGEVLVFFRAYQERDDIDIICRKYDECHGLTTNPEPANGANLYSLLYQVLL